ncbi:hypothetical protein ONZ45_g15371 [Pleurotus djamor]|nr:hypothetical protein ONZ45_g15371 [Pleurotus djamor]
MLDHEPVTQIAFDVPQPTASSSSVTKPSSSTFPVDMQPSFVTGVDGTMVSDFLMRFFTTFDSQRSDLLNAYHPSATFSYSVNTTIPTRARIAGLHTSRSLPNQRRLDWTSWISNSEGGSRNLSRGNIVLDKQFKSLHVGGAEIVKSVLALPGTKHDIAGPPEKFCVDSFPVPHGDAVGLLLVVHGEFVELGADGVRSFDRSFILAPAPEGSAAKINGWNVVILSDQWVIRHYSSCEAWRPGPLKVQAGEPKPTPATAQSSLMLPPEQQALLSTIPEFQRPLVLDICQRTSLNVKFAVDCLTGNQWDVERAVANFNEVKGTLGRDAFL